MQSTRRHILTSVSYVLGAQIVVMAIGVVRSLVLPAFLSVESYGYLSVYLFYFTVYALFTLGYEEGIFLRYGQYDYHRLPMKVLRPASRYYMWQLLGMTLVAMVAVALFIPDPAARFAMIFASLNILLMGLYGLLVRVLQITNQMKRYSFYSVVDKAVVLAAILAMVVIGTKNFRIIVAVDVVTRVGILAMMMFHTKELWVGRAEADKGEVVKEYKENIFSGIKLTIASQMGVLLIAAGRFITQFWCDIKDFAVYSFGITVTSIVLMAISAFSLVLYPIIKRLPEENYGSYFDKINTFTRSFGLLILLVYFPAYILVAVFYPKYIAVLSYLNLLFGIVYLQCKMNILNGTFYKATREEGLLLRTNMECLGLFVILVIPAFMFTRQIWVIALCTFIAMYVRCYLSEIYLLRKFGKSFDRNIIFETVGLAIFILSTAFCGFYQAMGIMVVMTAAYFYIERRNIIDTAMTLIRDRR